MTHPLELILHKNWTKILSLEIDIYDDGGLQIFTLQARLWLSKFGADTSIGWA